MRDKEKTDKFEDRLHQVTILFNGMEALIVRVILGVVMILAMLKLAWSVISSR